MRRGGSLLDSQPFVRKVVGSNPVLPFWLPHRDLRQVLHCQVKSSIRLLCKCKRGTDYLLIIAVTDASMIYRERVCVCIYSFYCINKPVDKPQLSYIVNKIHKMYEC